ncbi:MAG: hypothetical protein HFI49_05120 [Bacilli bacterium]|jgi:lysophospholipase L1-like esterase|nr:hypothetical protein [Bacilli bacterium]
MVKKVLIYGDSNTWGDNFITGKRIPDEKQWVNILKKIYSKDYIFLQEGLPGRLAGNEEKFKPYKNGKDTFISTFRTNAPVDIVIISLGTNDLQIKYNKKSKDIINDLLWYKNKLEESFTDEEDKIKYFNNKMPKIIYILPINFDYKVNASVIFDEECEEKRQEIIEYFKKQNINAIIANSLDLFEDGIHLSYQGHEEMAKLVAGEL